jgi:hypothetical protein
VKNQKINSSKKVSESNSGKNKTAITKPAHHSSTALSLAPTAHPIKKRKERGGAEIKYKTLESASPFSSADTFKTSIKKIGEKGDKLRPNRIDDLSTKKSKKQKQEI